MSIHLLTRYGLTKAAAGGGGEPAEENTVNTALGSNFAYLRGDVRSEINQDLTEVTCQILIADTYSLDIQTSTGTSLRTITGVVAAGSNARESFVLSSALSLVAGTTYRFVLTGTASRNYSYRNARYEGTKWYQNQIVVPGFGTLTNTSMGFGIISVTT